MDDAIVIGAGPNGLVAANRLLDAGWSVTVLEAAEEPGGAVRTGELTLPGFRHDLFSAFYPLAVASPVFHALHLEDHGLRWCQAPLALAHPLLDGRCAVISTDVAETGRSLDAFAGGDGAAWSDMFSEWRRVGDQFLGALFRPFPPVVPGVRLAGRLGAAGTLRLARHLLLPVRRMAEERFEGEGAALLLGGNALHTDLSPEAAGSGAFGWLLSCLGQQYGFPVPEGGAGSLTAALVARLRSKGGNLRCQAEVTKIIVEGGRAVGVEVTDGERFGARRAVLADVDAPRLYRQLVEPEHLPARLLADLDHFQWEMSTVKVDWALDGPIPWEADEARRAGTVHVADDFDNLTEFAADIAMGRLPRRPFLLVGQQSVSDPTRCPPGGETAWAYTHVPRRLRGDAEAALDVNGGEASWLPGFVERIERRIEDRAPGFLALVRGRHVFAPSGLQGADRNLDRGAINGGTAQLHQQLLFRPVPGSGRPETPVAGLYLASASAHPGGGVHGACGANAATVALRRAHRPRLRLGARSAPDR